MNRICLRAEQHGLGLSIGDGAQSHSADLYVDLSMPGSTLPDFLADGHVHASAAASHDAAGSATATAPASASVRLDNLNWTADETAIGGTAENWDALQAENIRLVLFIFDEHFSLRNPSLTLTFM